MAVAEIQPVKSADRVLTVLELLAEAGGAQTLTQMATELSWPKSSLHALLRTMQGRGWVQTDATGTRFALGLRTLRVGSAYVESDAVVQRTDTVLDTIVDTLGETVHLGRLDGVDIVYLAKRESAHPLRLFSAVGRRLPAYATALGKALLAGLPPDRLAQALPARLTPLTRHTITSRKALAQELERTRARGYASDQEENTEGLRCFAVALPFTHPAQDAVSVSVPLTRLDDARTERITATLLDVAAGLGRHLDLGSADRVG